MDSFNVMLEQCEKLGEKLMGMEMSDEFMEGLDIFQSYFEQLKQIVDNSSGVDYKRMSRLGVYLDDFYTKLEKAQSCVLKEIYALGRSKTMKAYSPSEYTQALKFDSRT